MSAPYIVVRVTCQATYHVQVERVGLAQARTLEADTSRKSQPLRHANQQA
jgi:hypothetical protein